jgi:hypothetical protein
MFWAGIGKKCANVEEKLIVAISMLDDFCPVLPVSTPPENYARRA